VGESAAGAPLGPLRVGLLLDGWRVPAWVARVVEELTGSAVAAPALVVLRGEPGLRPVAARRLLAHRRHLVYELYTRLDRRLFTPRPDPFARVSIEPLLAGVPRLAVRPQRSRFSDRFPPEALAEIERHDLDVLLRFGFRILRGPVLAAARHGVWSYHHDDPATLRGGPPGFWEVVLGRPATGSALQVLSERLDGGRVIYRSFAPTHRRSVIRNRAHVYWKSSAFVGRCLTALAATGDAAAGEAAGEPPSPAPYADRLYKKPANLEATRHLARFAWRAGRDKLGETTARRQWFLAWRFDQGDEADGGAHDAPPELFRFHRLRPPPDRSWADPFPLFRDGRWWLFFEEVRFAARRGHLRVLELDPERGAGPSRRVLDEPWHLSYPCVFEWDGEVWMVPESAERGQVCLYRADGFPDRWRREAVLLDGLRAVDATPFEAEGSWWMFANVAVPGSLHAHDELCLWQAPSPLGPWRPHPQNPVVSDARRARPAGRPFRWRGELIRPAQDCSRHYGRAVVLHRVLTLGESAYREEPIARLPPAWAPGLEGFHTFNRVAGLTVVDGLARRPLAARRARGDVE
jgi:methionyl-tRNA formyltransferase